MGRGIAIALAVSLAVNVFLGGYFIGQRTAGGDNASPEIADVRRGRGHQSPGRMLGEAMRISPAARAAAREAARPQRAEIMRDRREGFRLRRELQATLKAEPFDIDAVRAAASEMFAFQSSREKQRLDLFLTVFESMSPEERRSLLAALDEQRTERRSRRGRRGFGPRPGDGDRPPPPPEEE